MRTLIIPFIALTSLIGIAAPVQAAPAALHGLSVATPAITLVRQRCGVGMKRANAWQDKTGAWHGKCVLKR